MKYMGSKRAMLQNGLGELLRSEVVGAPRIVDLFAGSGAVAIYCAIQFPIPVLAFDLQRYSAILSGAVICRHTELNWQVTWKNWLERAEASFDLCPPLSSRGFTQSFVAKSREWCNRQTEFPVTSAYGGHYYSPEQSVWIDLLRKSLPRREPAKTVALAALIQAASQCAAAPGHTAQPFQPTSTALRFIEEAWRGNIPDKTRAIFESLSGQFAQQPGRALVGDANLMASRLREGDLVFIDPPYSGVHYSRFYHVLETIANGTCGPVTGVGRYPAREKRPRSRYSLGSESGGALNDLLMEVSRRRARAILTFPNHDCSNGLSGGAVREICARYFHLREEQVDSRFSTLGGAGNGDGGTGRTARMPAKELMLTLRPL